MFDNNKCTGCMAKKIPFYIFLYPNKDAICGSIGCKYQRENNNKYEQDRCFNIFATSNTKCEFDKNKVKEHLEKFKE